MNVIPILVIVLVFCLVLWIISTYVAPPLRNIFVIIVVVVLCIWLLSLIGFGSLYIGTHR